MVVFYHLSMSSTLIHLVGTEITNPFYWGVELFFVLSGYVVTKSVRARDFSPPIFFTRRLFRLFPAIVFLILFAALINAIISNSTYSAFIVNLFSVPSNSFREQSKAILGGYLINIGGPISFQYGAMWSLSVEFQFYSALMLILMVVCLFKSTTKEFLLKRFSAMTLIVLIAYRIGIGITTLEHPWFRSIAYLVNYRFDFLIAGVLLAFISGEFLEVVFSFARKKGLRLMLFVATTAVLAMVRSPLQPNGQSYDALNGFGMLFCLFACIVLVASGSVKYNAQFKAESQSVARRFIIRLGDFSYSIYLMHFSILILSWMIINEIMPIVFSNEIYYSIAQLMTVLVVSYPIILFLHTKIELPLISVGDFILEKLLKRTKQ